MSPQTTLHWSHPQATQPLVSFSGNTATSPIPRSHRSAPSYSPQTGAYNTQIQSSGVCAGSYNVKKSTLQNALPSEMWDATNLPGWPLGVSAAPQINVSTHSSYLYTLKQPITSYIQQLYALFSFLPTSYAQRTLPAGPKIALYYPRLFVCWFACDYVCLHLSCVQ